MYDLATRGMADFIRASLTLETQSISRDPLSGVLDGANTIFHTSYYPVLTTGSLGVYVGSTLLPGTADFETGRVTLDSPPTAQPQANYTFTPYTPTQIAAFTISGFLEMENRWTRGWQLLDGSGAWADESSANIYLVDSSGNDPVTGATVFSNSRIQVGFFVMCCEYRFMMTQYRASARNDFMWRESVRGMTVDKSKRPANINLAVDDMRDELATAMQQAQTQFYPGGEHFGAAILNPASNFYLSGFEWQSASKANDNWSLAGFNVSYRTLTFFA